MILNENFHTYYEEGTKSGIAHRKSQQHLWYLRPETIALHF